MNKPLREGILFILCGPAGAGKTTVAHYLTEKYPPCSFSVSVTSRAPRIGEKDGVDYHFVSEDVFKQKIAANEFFEYENVHGRYYGTLKSVVIDALNAGKDLLLDIDIKGALTFKRNLPKNAVIVFLLPPSTDVLKARLLNRGKIDEAEMKRRLQTAGEEYDTLLAESNSGIIDYVLINEDLSLTCSSVADILKAERLRLTRTNKDLLKSICVI
jgi:guanylate kinase